ncbi:MAG TPA: DUF2339 domain-containing protein, partial [Phycisphaerae bacterium]
MNPDELKQTLEQLAARLARLEEHLGLTEARRPRAAVDQVPDITPQPLELKTPPEVRRESWIEAYSAHEAESHATGEARLRERPDFRARAAAILARERETVAASPQTGETDVTARTKLEVQIGTRWMAWVGALVVVLAVAFFVKLAYDQGWWGRLPPLARCLLSAGFGAALLVAGEIALRRVGRVAAVGLFGAGIGTLYLTSYATFRYFGLLTQAGAFGLLIGVAILGFIITLRARMRTIGVLSIVGGYLSPVLLASASSLPWALPMYLTMLLGVSLGLSAALSPFRTLRYVALAGHAAIGLAWAIDEGPTNLTIAIIFMGVSWALVTAEAVYVAQRNESEIGNAIASLLFTAWFVTIGCWVLAQNRPAGRDWLGLFTAAIAGLSAALAMNIGPGLRSLRFRPQRAVETLAATLWLEAGVLLAAAIALQFKGYHESIGWLALGLACVEAGRRLPSKGVSVFGLIVGGLALLRVSTLDRMVFSMNAVLWSSGAVSATKWSILAVAAVIATHAAARRLAVIESRSPETLPIMIAGIGTLGWLWACAVASSGLAMTAGWLLGAVLLLAFQKAGRRQLYCEQAQLVLVAVTCKWLIGDELVRRLDPTWSPTSALPVLNGQMAMAVTIAACVWWAARLRSTDRGASQTGWAPAGLALLLIWGLVFETDRIIGRWELAHATNWKPTWPPLQTRMLWWTFLSAASGLLMLLIGRRRTHRRLIETGTVLMVAAALFWLAIDTVGWRVVASTAAAWLVLNQQFLIGVFLVLALSLAVRLIRV